MKSNNNELVGDMARMGGGEGEQDAYGVLMGRPKRRWEDNLKLNLQEPGW